RSPDGAELGAELGIAELVSAETQTRRAEDAFDLGLDLDVSERRQAVFHDGLDGQETHHRMRLSGARANRAREVHEAAAFGVDGPTRARECGDALAHRRILRELAREDFRVAAAEIEAVDGGELCVSNGRKPDERRAERFEPR